jgi:hypothetical protein
MELEICYVSGIRRAEYNHYNSDGTETDHQPGSMIEVFVPDERREDVDRNDATRRELTAIIEEAIAASEAG